MVDLPSKSNVAEARAQLPAWFTKLRARTLPPEIAMKAAESPRDRIAIGFGAEDLACDPFLLMPAQAITVASLLIKHACEINPAIADRQSLPAWLVVREWSGTKPARIDVYRPDNPRNRIAFEICRSGLDLTPRHAMTLAAHLVFLALQIKEGGDDQSK